MGVVWIYSVTVAGEVWTRQDFAVIEATLLNYICWVDGWDLAEKRGELSGGVLAVQGDLTLQCNTATVELGEDQGIVRAVALGNVRVTQGDKSATGGKAVLADGRLELTESPTLSTDIHQMTGSRIVFVVGEQSIECDDCTVRVGGGD